MKYKFCEYCGKITEKSGWQTCERCGKTIIPRQTLHDKDYYIEIAKKQFGDTDEAMNMAFELVSAEIEEAVNQNKNWEEPKTTQHMKPDASYDSANKMPQQDNQNLSTKSDISNDKIRIRQIVSIVDMIFGILLFAIVINSSGGMVENYETICLAMLIAVTGIFGFLGSKKDEFAIASLIVNIFTIFVCISNSLNAVEYLMVALVQIVFFCLDIYCLNGYRKKKEKYLRCPNCGTSLFRNVNYCSNCGYYFNHSESDNQNRQNERNTTGVAVAFGIIILIVIGFAYIFNADSDANTRTATLETAENSVNNSDQANTNKSESESDSSSKSETKTSQTESVTTQTETTTEEIKKTTYSVSNIEIYNGNNVSIVVTDIDNDDTYTVINMLLTNESEKNYDIAIHSYAVNDLMAGENLYGINSVEVAAGKKAKITLEIENEWLTENGFDAISEMTFLFWAYCDGYKDWDSGNINFSTSNESETYIPDGESIYNDDNLTVWLIKKSDTSVYLAIRNNLSRNLDYTFENCSVNEWSYEVVNYSYDYYNEELLAETYEVIEFEIDEEFLNEYEITTVNSIEFDINLTDYTGNYSDWIDVSTDKITILY